jgi:hypothetical protein
MTMNFTGQYIGNPYWPEMFRMIQISKESGMNRAKSQANRRKALEEHLRMKGLTLADYEKLEEASKKPFHTVGDQIVIPAERLLSFLVATCDEARSAQRPCAKEQVRSRFIASDFLTGKTDPDGVWSRFATVTAGTGNKLSNQRGLREDFFIEKFTAAGTLSFDPEFIDPKTLRNAVLWGGQFVGIGASRKMGKGRFELDVFEEIT